MNIDELLASYQTAQAAKQESQQEMDNLDRQIPTADRKTRKEMQARRKTYEERFQETADRMVDILRQYSQELIIVPGDESLFEEITGIPVKVIHLDSPNKGALLVEKKGFRSHDSFREDNDDFERSSTYKTSLATLLEHRVIGIINAQLTQSDWSSRWDRGTERIYYGLPVAKA